MIILRNNSHGEIIRTCMGIFTTALRNKKFSQKYLTLLPQCIAYYLTTYYVATLLAKMGSIQRIFAVRFFLLPWQLWATVEFHSVKPSFTTGNPSSSYEMIILRNNSHGEIIRTCMGIFTTALRNKKFSQKYLTLLPQCIAYYLTTYYVATLLAKMGSIQRSKRSDNNQHTVEVRWGISRENFTFPYKLL